MPVVPQVKNRAPAPIQITAEQLLREAKERGLEDTRGPPRQFITDKEELQQYQQAKRKDFEDQIRRQRQHIGTWCKYGLWEGSQKEFERARSVFERALDVDYRNQTLWLKYSEMELKNKFINHSRNIFDRAVALHPRVDKFWFKYAYMEEMIGAVDQSRQIFERWMKWEPDDLGWSAYIKFEVRQSEISNARDIYERYISCLPTTRAYLKYAKWEEKQGQKYFAREIYERSFSEVHHDEGTENLLINFARFEERCKEFDRARVIYKYALDNCTSDQDITALKEECILFEKRHGNRQGIEEAIANKRREQYEKVVSLDPYNYDGWFDYLNLEEEEAKQSTSFDRVRDIYRRATDQIPLILEKRYWRRYIYLWINFALFEELQAKDVARTRAVYKACLAVIPHKKFTFGKIWLQAAHLEVRQKDLAAARRLLGHAIGMCPKESVFKGYISLELQLGEVPRCRMLYGKYLEFAPSSNSAWRAFCQLEMDLGETARARALFEAALRVGVDAPEALWKAYVDLEVSERETGRVRALYNRLLAETPHVNVWISFGQIEASLVEAVDDVDACAYFREVFERGYEDLKAQGKKEERLLLLEAWREAEAELLQRCGGRLGEPEAVEKRLPRKVRMRRMATAEDGREMGWEEYYDYVFPDDQKKIGNLKILEKALLWKKMSEAAAKEQEEEAEEEEEGQRKRARTVDSAVDASSIDIDDTDDA